MEARYEVFVSSRKVHEIHTEMSQTQRENNPSYSTIKIWVARFQTGHFSVEDEPQSGRPIIASDAATSQAVHDLIFEDRRISRKMIAQILSISREHITFTNHNILYMRKFSAKWVPKCLTSEQKQARVQTSTAILAHFSDTPNFLSRLVTEDETWLHIYDPETKNNQRRVAIVAPQDPRSSVPRDRPKVMTSVFWNKYDILLVDYLLQGCSITGEYNSNLLY